MGNNRNKTKIVIIVLAVLLTLSIAALTGTFLYNRLAVSTDATVSVPDNLITPERDNDDTAESAVTGTQATVSDGSGSVVASGGNTEEQTPATAISLYNKQPQDNTAFAVGNMFPGDSETKYYGVRVSYHDKVTVHFKTDVRKGYETLAEAMKVKVTLLGIDEVMYDGLMKDMPQSLTYTMTSAESTTDEIYYEITAYLDTSVGNEYQNKDLVADFKWWVEETDNLDNPPKTGDNTNAAVWITLAAVSAFACILLLVFRRKEEDEQNG